MTREQQRVVLFLSLFLCLLFFLTPSPSRWGEPIRPKSEMNLLAKATPEEEIKIEVDGSVNRRGTYGINRGATVKEIIEKSGGLSGNSSLPPDVLLLRIEKSCRLNVGLDKEGEGRLIIEPLAPQKLKVLSVAIDINTAGLEELDTLPGIGPKTAQSIIEHRETYGKLTTPEDLLQVQGIGPKKLAAILPHITAQPRP